MNETKRMLSIISAPMIAGAFLTFLGTEDVGKTAFGGIIGILCGLGLYTYDVADRRAQ